MNTPTIITNETRELVAGIEECAPDNTVALEAYTRQLVGHLAARTALPEIKSKYDAYRTAGGKLGRYPTYNDGYTESFDILHDEVDLYDHWNKYGVVVGKNVVPEALCANAVARVKSVVSELSQGSCNIDDSGTHKTLPTDPEGVPILTRGFFEVYHDDSLAQLRQSVRAYLQHVVLWGQADIWTTYDRFGVKLPGHAESSALPLHVDQNPQEHPDFRTTQGILALEDCPADRGTLVTVPGSKALFLEYKQMAPERGEYVELDNSYPVAEILADHAQPLPLRQRDLVSWDSRTTHANTANISAQTRFVALIAAGPSREHDPNAVAARAEAFATGLGSNVRDALMHASKRPRYTNPDALQKIRHPEKLTYLGKLLYGQEAYGAV